MIELFFEGEAPLALLVEGATIAPVIAKCVACELCVKVCPVRAMQVYFT
jgi:formate hydrogenlyase subunit 6/NADH:ubiquinone oxidoreductase subunit I